MSEDFECEFDDSVVRQELERLSRQVTKIDQDVTRMVKILNEFARINRIQV